MSTDLTVGIAGGSRGSAFVRAFGAFTGVKVTALCDISPEVLERVAEQFGIPNRFTDYQQMLDSGIDIAVVATPMPEHVPQSVAALERNIHVLSEVPAAVTLQECCDLVDAVRNSSAKYMMGENYCYVKTNVLIKEMVRRGLFGELYFGEGEYVHELKGLFAVCPWRRTSALMKRGCTYPTHSLGPVLQWFDRPVARVACFGSGAYSLGDPQYIHDDTSLTLCELRGGGLVKIRLDMLSNRPHNIAYYSLQGTKGCYEAPRGMGDDHKVWLADFSSDPNQWRPLSDFEEFLPELWRNPPEEALKAGHSGGDYFQVRDFLDAIQEGREPAIDVYHALDFTVPGLVSEQSIAQGGIPLPVPDFREYVSGSKQVPGLAGV